MKKLLKHILVLFIIILLISGCGQENGKEKSPNAQGDSSVKVLNQPDSYTVKLPQINNDYGYYAAHWVSFSPDGESLAVAASNGIIIYPTSSLLAEPIANFISLEAAVRVTWSPDSEFIAYANVIGEEVNNGLVITTSIKDPYPRNKFDIKGAAMSAPGVSSLKWLPDGNVLYFDYGWSGHPVQFFEAWNLDTHEQIFFKNSSLTAGAEVIEWDTLSGDLSPDGKTLALGVKKDTSEM
jgi:WD40 repeat protein